MKRNMLATNTTPERPQKKKRKKKKKKKKADETVQCVTFESSRTPSPVVPLTFEAGGKKKTAASRAPTQEQHITFESRRSALPAEPLSFECDVAAESGSSPKSIPIPEAPADSSESGALSAVLGGAIRAVPDGRNASPAIPLTLEGDVAVATQTQAPVQDIRHLFNLQVSSISESDAALASYDQLLTKYERISQTIQ